MFHSAAASFQRGDGEGRGKNEGAGFCCQVPADPASYLLQQEGFNSRTRTAYAARATGA
jgi:hypothetical protein